MLAYLTPSPPEPMRFDLTDRPSIQIPTELLADLDDFMKDLDQELSSKLNSFSVIVPDSQTIVDDLKEIERQEKQEEEEEKVVEIKTAEEQELLELFQFLDHQSSARTQANPDTELITFADIILEEARAQKELEERSSREEVPAPTTQEEAEMYFPPDSDEEEEMTTPSQESPEELERQRLLTYARRSVVRSLIENSLFGNATALIELNKARSRGQGRTLAEIATAASAKTEEQVLDEYVKHVPTSFDLQDLDKLLRASDRKYDQTSVAEELHALENIGLFNHEKLILLYHEDVTAFPLQKMLAERVEDFMELTINIVLTTVIARIFPFVLDMTVPGNINTLHKKALTAVTSLLETATKDGQLKQALKRVIDAHVKNINGPTGVMPPDVKQDMEVFYDMKDNQDVENLQVDSFYFKTGDRCPLFSKYGNPKFIGAGAFGFVLRYFVQFPDNPAGLVQQYAIKVQRLTTNKLTDLTTPAYIELRILYEINRLTSHWSHERKIGPFNHVHLHDWVRCQFNPRTKFLALMANKDKEKYEQFMVDEEGVYQILVEEFATAGSLDGLIKNPASFERYASTRGLMSIFIQVFGHLNTLGKLISLSHRDIKPDNILVQGTAPDSPIKYLVYYNVPEGPLYLPIIDSHGHIFKIADYGRGRASVRRMGKPSLLWSARKTETIVIGGKNAAYNPAKDVENMVLMLLASALTLFKEDIMNHVDSDIFDLILLGIHDGALLMKNENVVYDYAKVISALTSWKNGKDSEANKNSILRSIYRIYSEHLYYWEDSPDRKDLQAFETIFGHSLFHPYRIKPSDLNSKNSINMDFYQDPLIRPPQ